MKNNSFDWFKLDNAAKIFPGQNTDSWSNMFRVGVELKEEVDPKLLEEALNRTLQRIPCFNVRIKPGMFWYYFEKNPCRAFVRPDVKNLLYRINFKENKGFLFRVYYHGKRISVDFYHALSDGYGNCVFVSTMVAQYLRLQGAEIPSGGNVLDLNENPTEDEMTDAYSRFACSKVKYDRRDSAMYHAKGEKIGRHKCNYTVGIVSCEELKKIVKSHHVTITEFFAAMLADIHIQKQKKEKKKQREICIQIPVNLRNFFPTKTLRNFVLCLKVKINPNYGEYTFEEILKQVSLQLRLQNEEKFVNSVMTQNMKIEKNPIMRAVPLPVKNLGIGIGFMLTAEKTTTAVLSNLGVVKLPEEMLPYVEKYWFFSGPGKLNGARCGVITCNDHLVFTFSNCYKESDIEREFFTRLVKMGIHVKIESNRMD